MKVSADKKTISLEQDQITHISTLTFRKESDSMLKVFVWNGDKLASSFVLNKGEFEQIKNFFNNNI